VAAFTGQSAVVDHRSGGLSYGQQKILGIGMAKMLWTQLVLMDEPAAGLNPSEKQLVAELIRRMRGLVRLVHAEGIAVILVEQNAKLALRISDRG
jgi:branched-chain amino acid transport system ATP-binding protein